MLNRVPVQPQVKAGMLVDKTIQIYFRRICIIKEFSTHRTGNSFVFVDEHGLRDVS